MKKILLTISFVAFAFSAAVAQGNIDHLCNTWQAMRYMDQAAGEAWSATDEQKEQLVTFHCNGTYEEVLASGETMTGKWAYDEASKVITVSQNSRKDYPSEVKFSLIELYHNYMVVDIVDDEGTKLRVFSTAIKN